MPSPFETCSAYSHAPAPVPRIFWIELTSRCPFDCIFCSRNLLRGEGEHMDAALLHSIVAQLETPELVRLNYSGETIHYPHFCEVIRAARATGAATELVSAFASVRPQVLREIVESGLDRLSVSLHTLDPQQFADIYRFSSLAAMKERIGTLLEVKRELSSATPSLDFAFVAMSDNVGQLSALARYAKEIGVLDISVHPVLRRDAIPVEFLNERREGRLTNEFRHQLQAAVADAQRSCPEVRITVANPDASGGHILGRVPGPFPAELPPGVRIHSCEQNPWETVHILANGDVVACEVHDKAPLGNLRQQTLREIWHGNAYRRFREQYSAGALDACRTCPWKLAYVPSPLGRAVNVAQGPSAQLRWGWHAHEGQAVLWSKPHSLLVLGGRDGAGRLRVAGILPPAFDGHPNLLSVRAGGTQVGTVVNLSRGLQSFDVLFEVRLPAAEAINIEFVVRSVYRPARHAGSADTRALGFALASAELLCE